MPRCAVVCREASRSPRGAMNNTALCPQWKLQSWRWPAHLLHPPNPLSVSTARRPGPVSQRVHLLHIALHSLSLFFFLCLGAGSGRAAEWISSGMTTARWHLSLFSIHPFSSLCRSTSARGHRPQQGHTHTHTHSRLSQHPFKCPTVSESLPLKAQSNRWSFTLDRKQNWAAFALLIVPVNISESVKLHNVVRASQQ